MPATGDTAGTGKGPKMDVFEFTAEVQPVEVQEVDAAPVDALTDPILSDVEVHAIVLPELSDLPALWRWEEGVMVDAMGIKEGEFGFGAWYPEAWELAAGYTWA